MLPLWKPDRPWTTRGLSLPIPRGSAGRSRTHHPRQRCPPPDIPGCGRSRPLGRDRTGRHSALPRSSRGAGQRSVRVLEVSALTAGNARIVIQRDTRVREILRRLRWRRRSSPRSSYPGARTSASARSSPRRSTNQNRPRPTKDENSGDEKGLAAPSCVPVPVHAGPRRRLGTAARPRGPLLVR